MCDVNPAAAVLLRTLRTGLAALLLALACHHEPPVAPGPPIPAAPDLALDTMEAECTGLAAALTAYHDCPNLDDGDRGSIDAWSERIQQDFAAAQKAKPDPNAQRAIAAACHKAIDSVKAANERCHHGKKPRYWSPS